MPAATKATAPKLKLLPVAALLQKRAAYNPRKIDEAQLASLRLSLRKFGFVEPVVVNVRTNTIVGGHQRLHAAHLEGIEQAPVFAVDLDEIAEKELNLALNKISGDWEPMALARVVDEIMQASAGDVQVTGFSMHEVHELLDKLRPPALDEQVDPDAVPKLADATYTQPGDVITLGRHLLACGDSTDPNTLAPLLARGRPQLLVTDPPYGVELDNAWRDGLCNSRPSPRSGGIEHDDRADWSEVFDAIKAQVIYVWHAALRGEEVRRGLERVGYEMRQQIIWVKGQAPVSRSHYHWRHEPCWYAVRKTGGANWIGDRKQTTVWEADSPIGFGAAGRKGSEHPTQKPVLLFERPIRNHVEAGGLICDPFAGSGTAIIAAERSGRACLAVEFDPKWCDVIVRRWMAFTGGTPEGWRGA